MCKDLQKCTFDDKPVGHCCYLKQKSYKTNGKELFEGVVTYIRPELKKKFDKLSDFGQIMMCKPSSTFTTCINPNHLGSHLSNKENERDSAKPTKAFKEHKTKQTNKQALVKWCQIVFHRFQNQQSIATRDQEMSANEIRGCSNLHAIMDCYFPVSEKHLEKAREQSRKRNKEQKNVSGRTGLSVIKVDPYSQCPSPEVNYTKDKTGHAADYSPYVSFK